MMIITCLLITMFSCGVAEKNEVWVEAGFLKKQFIEFFSVLGVKANCDMAVISLNSNNKGEMWEAIANATCNKAKPGMPFAGNAKCENGKLYILCK